MTADPVTELALQVCRERGYVFVERCSAGAFKHTFHITRGGEHCALKLVVGAIDQARIQREIDVLRACDHANISRLICVDTAAWSGRTIVYFIEEFLAAGTLSERLRRGLLSLDEGRELGISISEALAYLASVDIVHRDIKPDNIMYRADGTPVLIDLGIARHLTASTLTKEWAAQGPGTPVFSAPEQLLNDRRLIDWRTDQFALGITMSLALLGMHPYSDRDQLEDVVDRVCKRQGPLEVFLQATRERGMDLLARMVSPWPIKRFTRPAQLIAAWRDMRAAA